MSWYLPIMVIPYYFSLLKNYGKWLRVVVHIFNLSSQETGVWISEFENSQGYVVRLS
ncbi:mCG147305 [Mus musculus]|nr:mCG147305 [Mus musculus]